ncbi:MAG: xanthine dehydrogenase family protein subunit M, partial [Gemmatimonadota bacterium]
GVGGSPLLARAAAAALEGAVPTEAAIAEAARVAAAEDIEPLDDMHASAAYRSRLVEVVTREALTEAARRADPSR